ncbi:chitinase, partial [Streptomyces nigra]
IMGRVGMATKVDGSDGAFSRPALVTNKDQQGLGGTFFWELSGDTANGELIKAIR